MHVLVDALGERAEAAAEGAVTVAEIDVVVLRGYRPVRRERELEAGANSPAPAVFARGGAGDADGIEIVVAFAGRGAAARCVEQDAVPGVADAAGEHEDAVDARAVGVGQRAGDNVAAALVGEASRELDAEHEAASLPVV